MPNLPPELIDAILESVPLRPLIYGNGEANYLSSSVAMTLGNCALVCRDWVFPSRRILFYRVHLADNTAEGFMELVDSSSSTFLPVIREVELADGAWTRTALLSRILGKLHCRTHTVMLVVLPKTSTEWIRHYPHPATVTRLELADRWGLKLNEAARVISTFPALSSLKVRVRKFEHSDTSPSLDHQPSQTLSSFELRAWNTHTFLSWIQSARLAISNLTISLPALRTVSPHAESSIYYITSLGASLIVLRLLMAHSVEDANICLYEFVPTGFLGRNANLRELTIEGLPAQMMAILRKVASLPTLELLSLDVAGDPERWTRTVPPSSVCTPRVKK
ncbi:hypothetical protein FB45DRAFT_1060551 [Roridomyces roridus]|uniref:F-box domain-containing protein n=1 Tax=Roridomyces roridus TaxID=1738132 RepID=A0AAD7BN78_9AGAR|nr:hypothetical protein FB45DRAFT_1060551 [Roridomyces roridus]